MQDEPMPSTALKKKKTVFYIITKGVWGGAQKYVFDLATHLPPEEFNVAVIHGEGDALPNKLKDFKIPTDRILSLERDIHLLQEIKTFFKLVRTFRRNKPDVIHLNSSKIGGLGALAGHLTRVKKIIFTVHGFAFNEDRSWFQKKIILFLSWISIVFSTDVIFISKVEMNRAVTWPFIRRKSHLIYNGIESPDFLSREQARKDLADILGQTRDIFAPGVTVIGSIGELTKNKGYEYALPAVQRLPNCIYIIVGKGYDKQQLEIMSLTKESQEKIFFTGFIADASRYLKAFDVFLLASLKEGLPYVLLEAGLAACAVVATNVGGIPEIIENGKNGMLASPKSSNELETNLTVLIENPEFQQIIGRNLKHTVKNNFSIETMVSRTSDLY